MWRAYMNILIWGAGERAHRMLEKRYFDSHNILAFVDSNKELTRINEYNVYIPIEAKELFKQVDYVVIANRYYAEIVVELSEMNVEWKKIVITDYVKDDGLYFRMFDRLKNLSEAYYIECKKNANIITRSNEKDYIDDAMLWGRGKYSMIQYKIDYFRYRTFEFCANEIIHNNIPGAVAEFGVFRGIFASFINEYFKDRDFYLFDTFEGFSKDEGNAEVIKGRCNEEFLDAHSYTSIDLMLSNMTYRDNLHICKGLFPSSVSYEASNARYAFVSLDVDFEDSTYEGLKFFYPRMSENGLIFVHDYNTYYLEGVREAIRRFEYDSGIKMKKIPLADRAGTMVIIK